MKRIIQRFMPDSKSIKENKYLKIFGSLLHNPNLWHLNRSSVARAFAVGLFIAFVPIPFQMVVAAGAAILCQANLPISVALVWLSNPLTIPFIFYFCYRIGALLVDSGGQGLHFEANLQWIIDSFATIGPAFLVGCSVMAVLSSLLGYFAIHGFWRYSTMSAWKERLQKRK